MRGLWIDTCKGSQVHALTPGERVPQSWLQVDRGKCSKMLEPDTDCPSSSLVSALTLPPIEPYYKPVDYVEALAQIHEELETATGLKEKASLYLVQSFVFRGLGETKLMRRSLKAALNHGSTLYEKLIYIAWLKFDKRGEAIGDGKLMHSGILLEALLPDAGDDELNPSCSYLRSTNGHNKSIITLCIGDATLVCDRQKLASLSMPFHAMLNGCFAESRLERIDFSENEISYDGMKSVIEFLGCGELWASGPSLLLEILGFANRFCCEKLKLECDRKLAALVQSRQDAITCLEYALEENAPLLFASCLDIFLQELPESLHDTHVVSLLTACDLKQQFLLGASSSFALYSLLSQVAAEEVENPDLKVLLLERVIETASPGRQRAYALHCLGCLMLEGKHFIEACRLFEASVGEGHKYSIAGMARAKFELGQKHAALADINSLLSSKKVSGWMFMERSHYCEENERDVDLNRATELDPTLAHPYKFRAAALMDDQKADLAIAEINRVLGFKVTPDCLELRIYFCLACLDYSGAVRDVRALLTLNPSYTLYSGRVKASQLLALLSPHVEQWTVADCWMQLYDRWSSVDDIGSLAVVHQMLESDPGKGLLFFRQSLLLLRLNCPKAAMRSLQLARQHAGSEHEHLVYEGWILYDTGHREEALKKAEESIAIQRSFEAFFLKAYALADTSLDTAASAHVVELLEEALKCPSDGLRKGQALNNLGSVYVDCRKLDLAADCYISALKIRHTRAHQGLARVYYLKNDRTAAYEEMTKLIEKARNSASAYEKRSEYCERDKTMADLSMVTQLDPLRTYPYRYRAAVLMDSHKEMEAIMELSRAITFKADLQLLHLRAAFHECIGDLTSALNDCRAALSMDPNHLEIMELHSRINSREP